MASGGAATRSGAKMARNIVIYFSYDKLLEKGIEEPIWWAEHWKGEKIELGSFQVGEVIGYEDDLPSERIGLIIQWNNDYQLVTQI